MACTPYLNVNSAQVLSKNVLETVSVFLSVFGQRVLFLHWSPLAAFSATRRHIWTVLGSRQKNPIFVASDATSRLPNSEAGLAKRNTYLDFCLTRGVVGHRVVGFVEVGQQSQPIELHISIRLNPCLVFVEAHVRVKSCHADIDAWFSGDVIGVAFGKLSLVKDGFRQLDDVDVVVVAACHVEGLVGLDSQI